MKPAFNVEEQRLLILKKLNRASVSLLQSIFSLSREEEALKEKGFEGDFKALYANEYAKYDRKKFKYTQRLILLEEFEPYLEAQSAN